jgi:hypothetical protein
MPGAQMYSEPLCFAMSDLLPERTIRDGARNCGGPNLKPALGLSNYRIKKKFGVEESVGEAAVLRGLRKAKFTFLVGSDN